MFVVPKFPHLRDVEIQVNYRELIETPIDPASVCNPKFKQDPDFDPNVPFKPRKYHFHLPLVLQVSLIFGGCSYQLVSQSNDFKWGRDTTSATCEI